MLCECIERYTERVDYNQDIYIYIYICIYTYIYIYIYLNVKKKLSSFFLGTDLNLQDNN